jgi:hypothetical protein
VGAEFALAAGATGGVAATEEMVSAMKFVPFVSHIGAIAGTKRIYFFQSL